MVRTDAKAQRLYVTGALASGAQIEAAPEQVHYLRNVLRLAPRAAVLLFNGRDGEWRAEIDSIEKRRLILKAVVRTREQSGGPDLHYLFAPLKRARLDYMVEKATEMGVARLEPVITQRTQAERVNLERMRAHTIEAAEQCGILRLPEIGEPQPLATALDTWDASRRLIVCDERAPIGDPVAALKALAPGPVGVLIGPEGGFTEEERERLQGLPFVTALSLGPRILRADTAAVAALALVNAVIGDWL